MPNAKCQVPSADAMLMNKVWLLGLAAQPYFSFSFSFSFSFAEGASVRSRVLQIGST
jgi:hypothetical protein